MTERSVKEELKALAPEKKALAAWIVVGVAFLWFYWSTISHLIRVWSAEEDYQHGFFVIPFSLFLLWYRRDMAKALEPGRGSWWGLPFLGVWALMRAMAVYFNYGSLPELSIIPFLVGVTVFVGGWRALHWVWPSIFFLVFMIPLPGAFQGLASDQLQSVATRISLYVIQTFGIPAVAQGNVIQLPEKHLEVARACSGLRMLMLFFAICIGFALIARRPLWERLLVVASAAPIAVMSNVARIVITGVLFRAAHLWPSVLATESAEKFMHDFAGFLMMPIGMLLLWIELTLLSKLLIAPRSERPLVMQNLARPQPSGADRALRGKMPGNS